MSSLPELLQVAIPETGDQTVPTALLGCWRRNWIRFSDDGDLDDRVTVIWLQTASGMGDLRIDPKQQPHQTDSSCGITIVDESTSPYPTARWYDGDTGFAQQAVTSFPEAGWLDWHRATLMREMAPSGAYVEEWERLPGSTGPVVHAVATNAANSTNVYVAGQHVFMAVHRGDGEPIHEYSYGSGGCSDSSIDIKLSTRHERVGSAMQLDYDWKLVSSRHIA